MKVKKYPRVSLESWSPVFFLVGLVTMLSVSYVALEWKSLETTSYQDDTLTIGNDLDLDLPIVDLKKPPPPPPPPQPQVKQTAIVVVEDDSDIEEIIITSTETDQNFLIVDIEKIEEVVEEEEIAEIPFSLIEETPIYPGCEKYTDRTSKQACMTKAVMQFVQDNFNTELASDFGLEGKQRISVIFKIDVHGNTANIRARAPHPRLEQEAVRVISKLPQMSPGKQRGNPVEVLYSLPILFQVEIRK